MQAIFQSWNPYSISLFSPYPNKPFSSEISHLNLRLL